MDRKLKSRTIGTVSSLINFRYSGPLAKIFRLKVESNACWGKIGGISHSSPPLCSVSVWLILILNACLVSTTSRVHLGSLVYLWPHYYAKLSRKSVLADLKINRDLTVRGSQGPRLSSYEGVGVNFPLGIYPHN